jgi:hypothetical protein
MDAGEGIMRQQIFQQVVSLGANCRAKYNIQLAFGRYIAPRGVFDWRITPGAAVLEYLSCDFSGVFERNDLDVDQKTGHVCHTSLGVQYVHEFPQGIPEADLDSLYPEAREKHDKMCDTTRQALDNNLSTLFVVGEPHNEDVLQEIGRALAERCAHKRHMILPSPKGDYGKNWKGDSEVWKLHLSPYRIDPPIGPKIKMHWIDVKRKYYQLLPKSVRPKESLQSRWQT